MTRAVPSLLVACLALACVVARPAAAMPAHLAAVERHFDRFLTKSLHTCTICHLPSDKKDPESLDEFPHNAFGAAMMKAGKQLRAEGKKREVAARLEIVADLDSDGDGVGNLAELLLGHNPGDAKDRPTAQELAGLAERQSAYGAFLKSYRWQPFEPVVRPAVPVVGGIGPGGNPIDAFVEEQRAARGLGASAPAPKHVLLRRVYLDLIGLNPTPDEIAAFEADASPDAYEKVVDRLLASPLYGQRWGRHWMDVWRYSDWAGWSGGNQIRDSQPHIWRWRDWIVESLNADKGYDRMVVEMLAGDEVAPADEGVLRATGFLVRNYKMLSREQWMEDVVNHTSRAFLGVTMHCAKCHDHKFDPATEEDYFRLRAVFEPHNVRTDPVAGQVDTKVDGLVRAYDAEPAAQTMFYVRGDERTPDKARGAMAPGVPAFLGGELKVEPVKLPAEAFQPYRRAQAIKDVVTASQQTVSAAEGVLAKTRADAKGTAGQRAEVEQGVAVAKAAHVALLSVLKAEEFEDRKESAEWKAAAIEAKAAQRRQGVAVAEQAVVVARNKVEAVAGKAPRMSVVVVPGAIAKAARVLMEDTGNGVLLPMPPGLAKEAEAARGKLAEAEKALAKAREEAAAAPSVAYAPRAGVKAYPAVSSGRRLALARWMTSAKNPLAARVAVNHIWARHFAQGLVPSTDDFGRNGRPPTHPALVDWLAAELMSGGWRMKPIHRLIVTSAAYRQSSAAGAASSQAGASSDPDDAYLWRFPGKRMEAELVRDNVLWASGQLDVSAGGPEIDNGLALTNRRRSLYFRIAPEKEVEFLKVFDGPNPNECYCRKPTVIPQQALALGNSQLVVEQQRVVAKALAERAGGDADAFVRAAFLRVLARPATAGEVAACREYLAGQKSAERGRENLVGVLFNHNDFVTVR